MKVQVFTDGSCLGNPGPGGWAALIHFEDKEYRIEGGEPYTTNNRMELTAVIEGLKYAAKKFPKAAEFFVHSDSAWVVNTMTKNWKRKKNLDLWEQLAPLLVGKQIKWQWVRGHSGHEENEDCDIRAVREAIKQEKLVKENPDLARQEQQNLFDI